MLPADLYGFETWSLTLGEENGLRMFEKRVLTRIFGPKTKEMMGVWRKLHYEELCDLYCSPNSIRMIKWMIMWAGHVERMFEKRNGCRLLIRNLERKGQLGGPRPR
jgi:hypothetical protein